MPMYGELDKKKRMPRPPMEREQRGGGDAPDKMQRMADNLNAGRMVYYPPEIRQRLVDRGLIGERFLDMGPKPMPMTPDTLRDSMPMPMGMPVDQIRQMLMQQDSVPMPQVQNLPGGIPMPSMTDPRLSALRRMLQQG